MAKQKAAQAARMGICSQGFTKNDDSAESLQRIISDWYSNRLKHDFLVGSVYQNTYGVWDMHGLVWEWVYDFNSIVMNNDGRNQEEMPEACFAEAPHSTPMMQPIMPLLCVLHSGPASKEIIT